MARATATFTDTNDGDWEPADLIHTDKWLEQVLQNIEWIAQSHNHDADTADMGGRLRVREGKDIMMLLGAAS